MQDKLQILHTNSVKLEFQININKTKIKKIKNAQDSPINTESHQIEGSITENEGGTQAITQYGQQKSKGPE